MNQPIVINSLLCFVSNFRKNPNIKSLVDRFFPQTAFVEARRILYSRLDKEDDALLSSKDDIFEMYDLLYGRSNLPTFATVELTNMPLAILTEEGYPSQILTEIKALRTFVKDALDGRIEDSNAHRGPPTPSSQGSMNNSVSSLEFPTTPTHSEISNSADMSNSDISLPISDASPESDVSKPLHSSTPISSPSSSSQSSKESIGFEQRDQLGKRKAVRSLDDTVKKLSEKRRTINATSIPRNGFTPPWQGQIDAQAYLHMLRMMNPCQPMFNMMPSMSHMQHHVAKPLSHSSTSESSDEKAEEMLDEEEQSPSPSEERDVNVDLNEDNDSDKPFVCEHSNCSKRFANKFLLKKHQFIHTGLRPHTCPYCNKRFNRKDNLLRHKKTHLQNGLSVEFGCRMGFSDGLGGLFPGLNAPFALNMEPSDIDPKADQDDQEDEDDDEIADITNMPDKL